MASAEKITIRIYLSLATASVLLLGAAALTRSIPFVVSLTYGVVIGAANFLFLIWIVEGWLGKKVKKGKMIVSFLGKGTILLVIIALILKKGHVSPLPFLLGLSNVVLGILIYGLWHVLSPQDEEVGDPHA